jgi:hypothetical protein
LSTGTDELVVTDYDYKKEDTHLESNRRLGGMCKAKKKEITFIVYSCGLCMGLRIFYHPLAPSGVTFMVLALFCCDLTSNAADYMGEGMCVRK